MASVTHGAVLRPGMTSTSRISGTGLKKCMPPTRSGCLQAEAIAVIGMEEVLEAMIVSGPASASSLANTACLASSRSMMASMIRLAFATSSRLPAMAMRSSAAFASSAGTRPFSTAPSSILAM